MVPRGIRRDRVLEALTAVRAGEDLTSCGLDEPLVDVAEIDDAALRGLRAGLTNLIKQFPRVIRQKSGGSTEL